MTETTTRTPRTLEQKLASAKELVAKYERMIANGGTDPGAQVAYAVGNTVKFNFGRGDKARELEGTIVGERVGEGKVGKQLKVTSGEGFEQQAYVIRPGDITANLSAAPADDEAGDPLNQEG